MSKTERVTVRLPDGFDPYRHHRQLTQLVMDEHGDGFEIESLDQRRRVAYAVRSAATTEVNRLDSDQFEVRLPPKTRPTDGDKVAASLQDQNPGFYLTSFEPYLRRALLTRMGDDQARARGAVAVALGVKPWDIGIGPRTGGGFTLSLPATYVPSKHDEKLDEVAVSVVGEPGWFVRANPSTLTAEIIPASPPTFPALIPYPLAKQRIPGTWRLPIGVALGRGDVPGPELALDFDATPGALVVGTAGGGKAQPLDTRIPTPGGWTTIGRLAPGDEVLAPAGGRTKVLSLSDVQERDVWEVTLSDGQVVRCADDHLWRVRTREQRTGSKVGDSREALELRQRARRTDAGAAVSARRLSEIVGRDHAWVRGVLVGRGIHSFVTKHDSRHGGTTLTITMETWPMAEALMAVADTLDDDRWTVMTTREMAQHDGGRLSIDVPAAAVFEVRDLPMDPYTLGAWLGGGNRGRGTLTCPDTVAVQISLAGMELVSSSGVSGTVRKFAGISAGLKRSGVTYGADHRPNMEIPTIFARASIDQRLALIQGLVDTSGSVRSGGRCVIGFSSRELADQVADVVRSLGARVKITGYETGRLSTTRWRVGFTTHLPVARDQAKISRLRPSPAEREHLFVRQVRRTGATTAMRCLRVDHPDALYLTDGFVPTHNSVTVNALIVSALERGFELAIGDVPHKAVDFTWCKPFVRDGGWGCDSPEATLAMLAMIYEEGQRRAKLLAAHDMQKVQDLPDRLRPKPILVVLDELTGLFALEEVPKGIGKDHPLVQEALQHNLIVQMIKKLVGKIPAELRFVGIRIVLSTQMAQANTGITVPLKTNLANRMLLGSNPNEQARGHAFLDPRSAPHVPDNVRSDAAAARGVGVSEFEGQTPSVFKSYFASTAAYREHLARLGVPTTTRPEPTKAEIVRYTPSLDPDGDDGRPASRLEREGGWGERDGRDAPEPRLRGAAAAAHALRVDADRAKRADPPGEPPF